MTPQPAGKVPGAVSAEPAILHPRFGPPPGMRTISIVGDITFANLDHLADLLCAEVHLHDTVEIDVSGASIGDYSFIMLLCSTHEIAQSLGRTLLISGNPVSRGVDLLSLAWKVRKNGCLFRMEKRCLLFSLFGSGGHLEPVERPRSRSVH